MCSQDYEDDKGKRSTDKEVEGCQDDVILKKHYQEHENEVKIYAPTILYILL